MSIVLYTKKDCVWCEYAKDFLTKRNIPFRVEILEVDFKREWIIETFPLMKTFPIITENNILIGGYNDLVDRVSKNPDLGKILINE